MGNDLQKQIDSAVRAAIIKRFSSIVADATERGHIEISKYHLENEIKKLRDEESLESIV